MKPRLLAASSALLLAAAAAPETKPPTVPLRDVDVTYRMVQPVQDGPPLAQRMRWSVALGRLRVDPPSAALYMIVDYKAHRMAVVHPGDRSVLDMNSPGPAMPGPAMPGAGGNFRQIGPDQVAGQPCTQWQTVDSSGKTVVVCMTTDGVMLRASQDANVLLEATSVSYAPQDAAAFQTPDGYKHVTPGDP